MNAHERNLLKALIETSQWEWDKLPGSRSLIGRHVYLCIANEVLQGTEIRAGQPLKHVLFHPVFTDRAIRMKLREFELMGYIEMQSSQTDKRFRQLVPTQALIDVIDKHACTLRQAVEKTTICIEK